MTKLKVGLQIEDWDEICKYLMLHANAPLLERFFFELSISLEVERFQNEMMQQTYQDLKKSCKPMKKRSVIKV